MQMFYYFWIVMCLPNILTDRQAAASKTGKLQIQLTDKFKALLNEHVYYELIEKELDKIKYEPIPINSQDLVDEFSQKVHELLQEKLKVVDKLKASIEEAKSNEIGSGDESFVEMSNYHNMRDDSVGGEVVYVDKFSSEFKVSLNYSFVQVPTNTYKYKQSVLRQIEWSKQLDTDFKKNYKSSKDLQYQYYGDTSGIFRIYPGSIMPVKEPNTDLYDCRRRPWYIKASTPPKDVVIVIDYSGSMIGNNIGIAKIATSSLIDTLQENDFFNVITVNKEASYLSKVEYLMQATKENKEMMQRAITNLTHPNSIVEVDAGVDEAFKILKSGLEMNRTSGCNQAIMFITDGIEGDYAGKKSFETNNQDKRVRVFSYLIGRMKSPDKTALIKMACENRGHFYTIDTIGNVWDTVLEYLRVMSRPVSYSLNNNKMNDLQATYTSAYMDNAGFGMVMSVSKSVFEKEKNTGSSPPQKYKDLIGVAGTDISLTNISSLAPYSKMGVFSRAFIINNNGFVLVHPKFRPQTGYLPVPQNILIEDLEMSVEPQDAVRLKERMLGSKKSGFKKRFKTYYTLGSERYTLTDNDYAFKEIPDTDFVAGVAVTQKDKKYLKVETTPDIDALFDRGIQALYVEPLPPPVTTDNKNNNSNNENGSTSATSNTPQPITATAQPDNYTYVEIAPWQYCPQLEEKLRANGGVKKPLNAQQLFTLLSNITGNKTANQEGCDIELLRRLLVPAGAIDKAIATTATSTGDISNTLWKEKEGNIFTSVFAATSGGYQKMFVFNSSKTSKPFGADVLRSDLFQSVLSTVDLSNDGDLNTKTVIFSIQRGEGYSGEMQVTVARPFWKSGVLTAVTGATVSSEVFNKRFVDMSTHINSQCKNQSFFCAMLDDFGYVIASNQDVKYTGRFVGERMGAIARHLNESGYLTVTELRDTQAECEVSKDEPNSSAASKLLLTPAKVMFAFLAGLFNSAYWLTVQIGILLITLFDTLRQQGGNVAVSTANSGSDDMVSCVRFTEYYHVERKKVDSRQSVGEEEWTDYNCPKCQASEFNSQSQQKGSQNFLLERIPETNAFLLVVATTGQDECECFTDHLTPTKRHVILHPDFVFNATENPARFRRPPLATCLNETDEAERRYECGRASSVGVSSLLLTGLTVVSIWLCFFY